MRISDWSSDVCSSELLETGGGQSFRSGGQGREAACLSDELCASGRCRMGYGLSGRAGGSASNPWHAAYWRGYGLPAKGCARCFHLRSEEHTSELQSLMRISYAVFCLKKTNIKYNWTSKN